jgi:alkanesulfonate monooxygenase SsuD/methylene tetrahydromethanopterin reductase-like flavin-dependent oxidoreductase (luciferase family)
MSENVQFGWRVPAFPTDGSGSQIFIDQILANLGAVSGRFSSAWVADHFVPWHREQDPTTVTLECWTTLTYLAGTFPALSFGSIVMSQSYRPPALLAKMGATLQALSGGRFILGLGAGWKEDEYLAYGYEFPNAATRIHQMGEAAQIIRMMWREPHANFHGRFYHVRDALCEPRPEPPPPLLIGGGGRKLTLRYVAQYADWWNFPGGSVENYAELLDVLRGHCETVGREYDSIVKTWACECVALAPSSGEARRLGEASPFYRPGAALVGTPDDVVTQLRRFTDLGVAHFILRFADFPETRGVKLFAEEVVPHFARGGDS